MPRKTSACLPSCRHWPELWARHGSCSGLHSAAGCGTNLAKQPLGSKSLLPSSVSVPAAICERHMHSCCRRCMRGAGSSSSGAAHDLGAGFWRPKRHVLACSTFTAARCGSGRCSQQLLQLGAARQRAAAAHAVRGMAPLGLCSTTLRLLWCAAASAVTSDHFLHSSTSH